MTGTALPDTAKADPGSDAGLAAALLAVDPCGIGGVVLRAGAGPTRDRWLALLRQLLPEDAPLRRVPLHIADDRLLGGLDLAATLSAGRPVLARGLVAEADGGVLVLAMAERLSPGTAARLAAVLDSRTVQLERDGLTAIAPARLGMVALDEGIAPDECPPGALLDRLAIRLELDGLTARDLGPPPADPARIALARNRLGAIIVPDAVVEVLCGTALALGIDSVRAPMLALRVAKAAAALAGHRAVTEADASLAARLVLAPRATCLPAPPEEAADDPPPPEPPPPEQDAEDPAPPPDTAQGETQPLEEVVLAAAQAAIPPGLLALLRAAEQRGSRQAAAGRSNSQQSGAGRGRPAGVRRGAPERGQRLNVLETLRAAAPWQPIRRDGRPHRAGDRLSIRADDFRVTRTKRRTRTTTIFVVDASGSAAFHRLAEAKGAVELLLGDCYVRRDQVALLAFRGASTDLLLPPTRSLVRAKRCLAELPGGGGTPLAAGIAAAGELAQAVKRRGEIPAIVVLTDGRANVGRDGAKGRAQGEADALAAARHLRAEGLKTLLVDTSRHPEPAARRIAAEMDALYLPLPSADARTLSTAVSAAVRGPLV